MADTGKTIGLIKALASVDPEAIKSSVDDWLDDHPEATTTVEDGAITKAKLDSSLQQTVDDVGDLKSAFDFNQKAIKQTADEALNVGGNMYSVLDGYAAEGLYIRTSDSKYQENSAYTLIIIPIQASSGATLYWKAFDEETFSSADLHCAVAVSYPVVGGTVSALGTSAAASHKGNITLTENINYLLINYVTNNYTGTAEEFVRALVVTTSAYADAYAGHYKASGTVRSVNGVTPDGSGAVTIGTDDNLELTVPVVDNSRFMPEFDLASMTFHAGTLDTQTGKEGTSTTYAVTDFIYKPYDAIIKVTIGEGIDRENIVFFFYTPGKEFIKYQISSSGFDILYRQTLYFKLRYTTNDPSSINNKIKVSVIPQSVLDYESKINFNNSVLSMPLTTDITKQLFNKYNYLDERYFLWGYTGSASDALDKSTRTVMFAIPLDGILDSDHLLYSFNLLETTTSPVTLRLFASNKFPFTDDDVGTTVFFGSYNANLANRRGKLTLSATTYKYLVFQITYPEISDSTPYANIIYQAIEYWKTSAEKLVIRAGDYDTIYHEYYTYQLSGDISEIIADAIDETVTGMIEETIASDAVPKFLGAGNANKQLVVDSSGYVTTGETTASNIGENDVRYMPTRTIYVGSNLISGSTPASGTGWSGDFTNGFTHASGNIDPLVVEAITTANAAYIVDFDLSSDIAEGMFISIGDGPKADVYHGSTRPFVGVISDGGYLKIWPISSWTGTITNLKMRPVAESGTELTQECRNVTHGTNINELSGWNNVAIAHDALKRNVNGTRNVVIGDGAAGKMISGNRNITIGPYAMPFVSEGERNVSIGADTLYNPSMQSGTSKAYDNVAIGKATMRNGEVIQNNIAVGKGAMSMNDLNANGNVAIGVGAGYYAKNYNTYVGYQSGYWLKGEDNTCIGKNSGNGAYITGSNNVFIGSGAKPNVSGASSTSEKTVNNSIAIGKDVTVDGSNQIVIGKAIHTVVKIAGKTISFNQDGTVTWS